MNGAKRQMTWEELCAEMVNQRTRAEAAEARCQSLLDQSSRWEAQALEVGQENERLKLEHDYEITALDDARKAAEARLVECEGVSLLRKKSEETWERQYYRAEARCAELEARVRELRVAAGEVLEMIQIQSQMWSHIFWTKLRALAALAESQEGKDA